ncbi:hypothetical protein E4U53_003815 [Claviceps sorghi]|nr:hypothetical protein E4U53_003815 [Claviceps sorghi]
MALEEREEGLKPAQCVGVLEGRSVQQDGFGFLGARAIEAVEATDRRESPQERDQVDRDESWDSVGEVGERLEVWLGTRDGRNWKDSPEGGQVNTQLNGLLNLARSN